jgi:hypothetical protein
MNAYDIGTGDPPARRATPTSLLFVGRFCGPSIKEVRVPIAAADQFRGVLGASIVDISPNQSSIPGSSELTSLAGGLEWVALLIALVGFVVGAAAWAIGSHSNNYQSAAAGRRAVLVSGAAALVIGAAPAVVNFLYSGGTAVKP